MNGLHRSVSCPAGTMWPEVIPASARPPRWRRLLRWVCRALACASFGISAYIDLSVEATADPRLSLQASLTAHGTFTSTTYLVGLGAPVLVVASVAADRSRRRRRSRPLAGAPRQALALGSRPR